MHIQVNTEKIDTVGNTSHAVAFTRKSHEWRVAFCGGAEWYWETRHMVEEPVPKDCKETWNLGELGTSWRTWLKRSDMKRLQTPYGLHISLHIIALFSCLFYNSVESSYISWLSMSSACRTFLNFLGAFPLSLLARLCPGRIVSSQSAGAMTSCFHLCQAKGCGMAKQLESDRVIICSVCTLGDLQCAITYYHM